MSYGIKHKETGLFFAGFNADDSQAWTANDAEAWARDNILHAETQASALVMVGVNVQRKPVTL